MPADAGFRRFFPVGTRAVTSKLVLVRVKRGIVCLIHTQPSSSAPGEQFPNDPERKTGVNA
jgi:hypothetical protein